MMDYLAIALYFFMAYLVFQHITGPVMIYERESVPFRYSFVILDSDSFLEDRNEIFRNYHDRLIELGFKYVGSSRLARVSSTLYFSLYSNDDKRIAATLVTGVGSGRMKEMNFIELVQVYSDKSALSVSNSPMISTYPEMKTRKMYRYPDVHDCRELVDRLRIIAERQFFRKEPVGFVAGKEFRAVENYLNEELHYLIEKGYYSDTPENGEFRLTIKGAVLFTWKNLWPWKDLIDMKDRLIAKKMIL